MRKVIILFSFIITIPAFSQQIVNLVLVGEKGITEDIKEARSFIVIKQYPDGFQRLDYNLGAPLERVRTYSDSTLTVLNGPFYEYSFNGALTLSGQYINNVKEKEWYYYNDTGKIILEQHYEHGILVKTINPDTLKKEKDPYNNTLQKVEVEAQYKKGDRDWKDYLVKNLDFDVIEKSVKGGKVHVGFTVNTSGKCVDVYLRRSVEFVLDEEAIRIIENSPLWHPAVQDGKKVNAYRTQPLTFAKED
ncbi:MAG TPA: energy transducer TonB [Ferruginibacter sp.]|nr:energy transducer TonB [Ferruginibacter sp.]